MTKTTPMRVALLCDIPGLWWAATRFSNARVDYTKLRQFAAERANGGSVESHAWLHDKDGIDKFEKALNHMGYNTSIVPRGNAIDALIAAAALDLAQRCEVIIIAASSGRYTMLKQMMGQATRLEICAFPVQCPLDEMNGRADHWHVLSANVLQAA